jgi:STE24 endopeptidase
MKTLDFSHEEVERAARYHRPRYLSAAASGALVVGVNAALAWSPPGARLWRAVEPLGWAGAAAAWAALVLALGVLLQLPLAYWGGLLRERRWGFSLQSTDAWLADWGKGLAVTVMLAATAWTATVGLARALPGWWPLATAVLLAGAVLLITFVAPVALEPLFNRFGPLADEQLAGELRSLGVAAGVPVREVLVADASRRTTRVNAYVSGLGTTRRIVLYDTLLAAAAPAEVRLVVAHELGHRRDRHVLKGTVFGMAGAAVAVLLLWAALGSRVASPRELPIALLVLTALELAVLVPAAAISRSWERAADLCSLELTGDLDSFERVQIELARKNLSDLAPPRLVYWFLFSHPTPRERLAAGRAWAVGAGA